jgi:hypothetical protein
VLLKRILTTTFLLLGMLPLTALGQSGGGSVTVTSDPGGAQVRLTGDATLAGVTPTTFRQFLLGDYDLIVSKPGYETYKERVLIDPSRPLQFSVSLSPKTRLKAALRSTFVPGWGQHYTDQHTKAWLFHTLAIGSVIGYLITDHNFDIRYEKYIRSRDEYDAAVNSGVGRAELERLLDDLLTRQEQAFDHEDYRRIAIGSVIGTWTLSVLDALLFLPDHGANVSVGGVSIQPGTADSPLGLNLSYRF